ncbi:MAG: hypothetical protein E6Q97_18550 [Desulfurellales bacterium]|nr:MAG: hypothetical protein E6Q97_18550 [Desulfurellales bacterium]
MTHIADIDKSRLSKANLIGYRRCAAQAYTALAQGRGEEYDYVCRHATSWLSVGINPQDAIAAYEQSLVGFVPPAIPASVSESLRRDAAHFADVYLHMSIWEQLEIEYGPNKGNATPGTAAGVVCLVAWLRWLGKTND